MQDRLVADACMNTYTCHNSLHTRNVCTWTEYYIVIYLDTYRMLCIIPVRKKSFKLEIVLKLAVALLVNTTLHCKSSLENEGFKFVTIDADINHQNAVIRQKRLNRRMGWVFRAKDVTPCASKFPHNPLLIAHSNVLLQPTMYGTRQQYTYALKHIAK